MPKRPKTETDDFSRHIGQRIRLFRTAAGLSLEALGSRIGVTYQQIQKYEKGANRVSATTLAHIAQVLNVNVAVFFLSDDDSEETGIAMGGSLRTAQQIDRLTPEVRNNLIALVDLLSRDPHVATHSSENEL